MAYGNKIGLQIAPPTDAQPSERAHHENFGVRELALAFPVQRPPRPWISAFQLLKLHSRFPCPPWRLITNDNPTRIVTLSDQRESKGLFFRSLPLKPSQSRFLIANLELEFLATHTKLGLLTFPNRKKNAIFDPRPSPPISEPKNPSSPLAYPDDRCRTPSAIHQHISNRSKNACSVFSHSRIASHELRATSHDSRTTTRAAFRSTIPARPHAHR